MDMEEPVDLDLGFEESDQEHDEDEEIPSEDCSCHGRPVTDSDWESGQDSDLESGEDLDMKTEDIVESVLDDILDRVMFWVLQEDSRETNDTLGDSGPWEDNNGEAMVVEVQQEEVQQEEVQQEEVQQEEVQQEAIRLGLRRSDRLKMKLKRL